MTASIAGKSIVRVPTWDGIRKDKRVAFANALVQEGEIGASLSANQRLVEAKRFLTERKAKPATQFTGAVLDFALSERSDHLDKRNAGRGKTHAQIEQRGERFHAAVGQVARRVIRQSIGAITISVNNSTDEKDGPKELRKTALKAMKKNWVQTWDSVKWLTGRTR